VETSSVRLAQPPEGTSFLAFRDCRLRGSTVEARDSSVRCPGLHELSSHADWVPL